ncbi:MAG TPA: hypothetical protein VMX13_14895 [Sedimentisphaerales bacterium]|nr:hypothetical protein [Sedimentisphaerales bacterium]
MNREENNQPYNQNTERLKDIPKWTRRYAQNRTLTILVLMVMTMLFGMFFAVLVGFPFALAVAGFRKGNIILGCVGIAVLVAVLVAYFKCLLILNRKFGGKNRGLLDRLLDQRIYGKEGTVSTPQPKLSKKKKCLGIFVGIVYMVCILGSMELAMIGYIPVKYLLPFMALFVVPFGVYQYFILWPRFGPVLLIYPILYAIHAILIIAGLPIFFTGLFAVPLNMLLPIIYNLLAYLIGHLYSRYTLKKLKGLTHLEGEAANGD